MNTQQAPSLAVLTVRWDEAYERGRILDPKDYPNPILVAKRQSWLKWMVRTNRIQGDTADDR